MVKKSTGILLALLLAVTMMFGLAACNKNEEDNRYTIVYLGDSIAEALIGPSPLSERDNYGYYAIVGKTNGYKYYNHSVSGHKTSTGIVSNDGLLEMVSKDTEDAVLMKTHIQQADMIHISVLGNNMLQYDLGLLMLEVADPEFEAKYEAGKTAQTAEGKTLINALEEGSIDTPLKRYSIDKVDENSDPVEVEFAFPPTYSDIGAIVTRLKELNPTATIVFQKVYNPFFEGSKHLSDAVLAELATVTDDGRFGAEGQPINTIAQVRKVADYLLGTLNGLLDRYLEEHPGAFRILDARAAFEQVAARDQVNGAMNLSGDSLGRKLIYEDWTHPSNFGHAVIAGMTQDLLNEMQVASPDAVKNYKAIRVDQINRLFKSISGFNADAAINAINGAETYLDVTLAYFEAIEGYTPVVPANSVTTNNSGTSFDKNMRFSFDTNNISVMQFDSTVIKLVCNMVLDMENSYVEFGTDGRMHLEIKTKPDLFTMINDLLTMFKLDESTVGAMLENFDISGGVDSMVEPMFPGFKAKLLAGDLGGALKIIQDGLGFNIVGLDYENENVKYILNYVAQNMKLPPDLLSRIPADTQLTLTFDSQYYIKDVKGADGTAYKAIYVSHIGGSNATQPYGVFDVTTVRKNNQDIMQLRMRAEFMNATLTLLETA